MRLIFPSTSLSEFRARRVWHGGPGIPPVLNLKPWLWSLEKQKPLSFHLHISFRGGGCLWFLSSWTLNLHSGLRVEICLVWGVYGGEKESICLQRKIYPVFLHLFHSSSSHHCTNSEGPRFCSLLGLWWPWRYPSKLFWLSWIHSISKYVSGSLSISSK